MGDSHRTRDDRRRAPELPPGDRAALSPLDEAVARYDAGDAWDDASEVVELDVRAPLDKVMPVRLTAGQWTDFRRRARAVGVGPSTLARMWIVEKLTPTSAELPPVVLPTDRSPQPASRTLRAAKRAPGSGGAATSRRKRPSAQQGRRKR